MKKVFNSTGDEIGLSDGKLIKDIEGNIIYWLSDDEVFAPTSYADSDLTSFNKGQFGLIGKNINGLCIVNNELVFRIENKIREP